MGSYEKKVLKRLWGTGRHTIYYDWHALDMNAQFPVACAWKTIGFLINASDVNTYSRRFRLKRNLRFRCGRILPVAGVLSSCQTYNVDPASYGDCPPGRFQLRFACNFYSILARTNYFNGPLNHQGIVKKSVLVSNAFSESCTLKLAYKSFSAFQSWSFRRR